MAADGTTITITIQSPLSEGRFLKADSHSASSRVPRTSFDGPGSAEAAPFSSHHSTQQIQSSRFYPERWFALFPEIATSGIRVRSVAEAPSFNLVANGKSSGEAFEFQVIDPTGKLKEIRVPDGLILEPIERDAMKPVTAEPGQKMSSHKLSAFCVDFAKEPPEQNGLFRVALPEVQEKYKPVRAVIRAGRELAEAGKFHPDSEPKAYMDSIRQYALWTKLEGWNQQQFADHFVERTGKTRKRCT